MTALADVVHSNAADFAAAQAATCPKCGAGFAWPCQSTGGGNYTTRPTHQARKDRVAGWDADQRQKYGELVLGHRRRGWDPSGEATPEQIAEAEKAANPIPGKDAKQPSPRGVRLSQKQAEWIELAAENGGKVLVSTAHLHGDATRRQIVHALRDKGILAEGDTVTDGWEQEYTLTDYGWQVYLKHRLIIRRPAGEWAALNRQERR